MRKLETTLLILRRDDQILLAKKKRGFGQGKYNGVSGKIEPNETIEEAMLRETKEEIAIVPTKYEKVGIMEFIEFYKGERQNVIFHLYIATNWSGEPKETDEMIPKWFSINEIPYDNMFPDDKYWLPYILNGEKIHGFFEFDENWNLLSQKFESLE